MNNIEVGYRSPVTLSRLAMVGVGLVGLCMVFGLMIGVAQVLSPEQSFEGASLWFLLQGLLALVQFPVYVFAVVMFLLWLHRVYTNLPALRSDNNDFTPGWAVGWWFIPFANLIKPFQAVRNAWAESDPDVDTEMGFLSRVQPGAPAFMALWWGFWLAANIVNNITNRFWDPEDVGSVESIGYLFILSGLLWAIAAALAIWVISVITDRQERRFRAVGVLQPQAPPPPPTFGSEE